MISIQGYALPFDRPAYVDGLEETVAPTAITAPTRQSANVTLLFGDHVTEGRRVYAQTRDGTFRFFTDDFGLAFSASIDDDSPSALGLARAIGSGEVSRCSVNFTALHRRDDGRVFHARIDHVSLVVEGAYADTGCWLANQPLNERPTHIREMAARYGESVIARTRQDQGRAPVGATAAGGVVRHGVSRQPSIPSSVAALLDRAEREGWAARSHEAWRVVERRATT